MIQLAVALAALGGIAKAGGSIYAGQQASTEAKYNARLKEQEAGHWAEAMDIQWFQDSRIVNRGISTAIQKTAKSGVEFSGSPLAATLDMATQMEYDKSINQWNLKYKKDTALAEMEAYYKRASNAKKSGWINAFSDILQTASKMVP